MDTTSKARVLVEAAERLGWKDAAEIASFAKQLQRGLPAEDELCAVFHWLGRCRLVHRLDQFPYPPGAWERYRVPDLLAVFDVAGRHQPVLVEVKTSRKDALSWKPEYLGALRAYADVTRLPLLIAWKHRTFWTLFEAQHFRVRTKNLGISFADAMAENLLGILAGDFTFSFRAGTGAHLRMKKLSETPGGFEAVIEEAYLSTADGARHNGAGGVLQLFICSDQEPSVIETDTEVLQSFVIPTDDQGEFAHRALTVLLDTFSHPDERRSWRQVLMRRSLPLLDTGPFVAATNALHAGLLQHVLMQRPRTLPEFIDWETVRQRLETPLC